MDKSMQLLKEKALKFNKDNPKLSKAINEKLNAKSVKK